VPLALGRVQERTNAYLAFFTSSVKFLSPRTTTSFSSTSSANPLPESKRRHKAATNITESLILNFFVDYSNYRAIARATRFSAPVAAMAPQPHESCPVTKRKDENTLSKVITKIEKKGVTK